MRRTQEPAITHNALVSLLGKDLTRLNEQLKEMW